VHWAPRADGSRQLELRDVCRLKRYTSTEANRCLAGKHLSMIGDSLTRYLHLSLAFLLERGTFPPRFRRPPAPQQPCRHVDEAGRPTCSSYDDATPNICVEFEWGSWDEYYGSLGGGGPAINGSTGGILNGRMECRSHRPSGQGETNDNTLYVNGGSRATLSFAFEVGWGDVPKPLRGYYFSNCSSEGSCRRTFQDAATIANRTRHSDYDGEQTFPEAIAPNGTLRTVLPTPPDYAIYNRGVWGLLPEARARRIMPLLKDWVSRGGGDGDSGPGDGSGNRGRCFFRSTTANYQSLSHGHLRNEHLKVRPHAHRAGCSYLDYAHLTEPFAALDWDEHLHHPASTERKSVFVDAVRTAAYIPAQEPDFEFRFSIFDRPDLIGPSIGGALAHVCRARDVVIRVHKMCSSFSRSLAISRDIWTGSLPALGVRGAEPDAAERALQRQEAGGLSGFERKERRRPG
jgi:hypothetical protein